MKNVEVQMENRLDGILAIGTDQLTSLPNDHSHYSKHLPDCRDSISLVLHLVMTKQDDFTILSLHNNNILTHFISKYYWQKIAQTRHSCICILNIK